MTPCKQTLLAGLTLMSEPNSTFLVLCSRFKKKNQNPQPQVLFAVWSIWSLPYFLITADWTVWNTVWMRGRQSGDCLCLASRGVEPAWSAAVLTKLHSANSSVQTRRVWSRSTWSNDYLPTGVKESKEEPEPLLEFADLTSLSSPHPVTSILLASRAWQGAKLTFILCYFVGLSDKWV